MLAVWISFFLFWQYFQRYIVSILSIVNGELQLMIKLDYLCFNWTIFRNISGKVECLDQPVVRIGVKLLEHRFFSWRETYFVKTDVNGRFSMSGIPDEFTTDDLMKMRIRIDYEYDDGPHR